MENLYEFDEFQRKKKLKKELKNNLNEEVEYDYFKATQEYIDDINSDFFLYEIESIVPSFNELDPYGEEEWESERVINKIKIKINKIKYEMSSDGNRISQYWIEIVFKDNLYNIFYYWGDIEDFEKKYIELVTQQDYKIIRVARSFGDFYNNGYADNVFTNYVLKTEKLKQIKYNNTWIKTGCNY